jgi:hypothetical protein
MLSVNSLSSDGLLAYRWLLAISGMSWCFFEVIGVAGNKVLFAEDNLPL